MQLNSIDKIIEDKLPSEVGYILYVKDGICEVNGLEDAMAGELVHVINRDYNKVEGMVLQILFKTLIVILFASDSYVDQGCVVVKTDRIMSVTLDYKVFGKVLNGLGDPQVASEALPVWTDVTTAYFKNESISENEKHLYTYRRPIDTKAAGIIERAPVRQPMLTGILAVDSLTPIGCGQRELIIGDRQTGKTTIAIDSIINQGLNGTLHCVYVSIGQKRSSIAKLAYYLNRINVMKTTTIVAVSAAETATLQYLSPFTGCTLAEWFGECGGDSLVIYDDLTKQAVAYRQISLLLRRSPTREAFPGDVFYLHARLLERAAKWSDEAGGGSATALPIVETQAGDVSAFVPTNVISITDGQIYLEALSFSQGIRPAVNAGISVSRVGSAAQVKAMKVLSGDLKLALAQYREVEAYSVFANDLDSATQKVLFRGLRLIEVLNQRKASPRLMETQVILLYAGIMGYFDEYDFSELVKQKNHLLTQIRNSNILMDLDVADRKSVV